MLKSLFFSSVQFEENTEKLQTVIKNKEAKTVLKVTNIKQNKQIIKWTNKKYIFLPTHHVLLSHW